MFPVPAPTVKRNDIAGARKTTDFGRLRMTFAATDTIQSMPPAACMVEAAVMTVMMLSLAGIPMTLGFIGKFYVLAVGVQAHLWWLTAGVVIGSANASTAALGFDGRAPRHVELGAYHPPGADMWQAARTWFDDLYRPAARVDDDALARARMSWRPPPPALDARPGSLLDAVRLHPDRYRALGFFLEKIPLTEPEARTERAASMAVARSRRERDLIAACSVHDMFTGLTEAEVRDTPPFFIEFWQTSGEGIRVFGRRVEHRDRENGTLYTSKDARAVGRQVPGGMPSLAEAARNDNATVRALLARRRSGARFLGPDALVRAMEEH